MVCTEVRGNESFNEVLNINIEIACKSLALGS